MAEPPPDQATSAPPSAKALGKRPAALAAALDSPALSSSDGKAANSPVAKAKEREKRVTRSSLGGAGSSGGPLSREGSAAASEALAPPLYLPRSTPILLCMQPPPTGLTHYPPLLLPADALTAAEDDGKDAAGDGENPPFRLLEVGDAFGRSRHAGAAEVDTSDAFYHRLHRFPEVLEKRSARLERERLIHERSKLILELEELRGRGWVYQGAQGGKGEEERRRRIKEGEERLKRYDSLLPNQPRKSNFLKNDTHLPTADSNSRAGSPAVPSTSAPNRSASHHPHRHSTPVSASGDGSTTIKIKFIAGGRGGGGRYVEVGGSGSGAGSSSRGGGGKGKASASRFSYAEPDSEESEEESDEDDDEQEEEEEEDEGYGESSRSGGREGRAGPKRDRKAERARAEERVRHGIPARSNRSVDTSRKRRRSSREGEEEEGDWEDNDLEDDEPEDRRPARPRRVQQLAQIKAAKAPRRIRLPDSFFQTRALRDSFLATLAPPPSTDAPSSSTRRSSSRLAYAFGQRLPDAALLRVGEFELFGGVAGDDSDSNPGNTARRLEEMVVEREGEEKAEVWGGRVVPKSALEVERRGPIIMGQAQATNGGVEPGAEESSASEVELAPLPSPPIITNTRPRRRSSVSNGSRPFTDFAAPRNTLSRPRRTSTSQTNGNGALPLPLETPPTTLLPAVAAFGWAAPGNESSSSLTSLQPTSADESLVERGAAGSPVKKEEAMVVD